MLEGKSYSHITVQDIIDEANIGRSTFYAHFGTRDELLNAMCRQIFDHIFSDVLRAEETHDFSQEDGALSHRLSHLLYHLKEQKKDILHVLSGESGELFLGYFKNCLRDLFAEYRDLFPGDIPEGFALNHYASSFSEAVKWWVGRGMEDAPESIVGYYAGLTGGWDSTGIIPYGCGRLSVRDKGGPQERPASTGQAPGSHKLPMGTGGRTDRTGGETT